MTSSAVIQSRRVPLRIVGLLIVGLAIAIALFTLEQTNIHPRTDDATVFANLIGIAPQVDGPIVRLYVKDNELVKAGQVLFQVDPTPYEYTLQKAISDQATLEKQILDEERIIAGQRSAVGSAQATVSTSQARVSSSEANINAAKAAVAQAEAAAARADAELKLAADDLRRLEPLLQKQFVTVQQIDRARTQQATAAEALRQARAQVEVAKAQLESALAQRNQAASGLQQSHAQLQQSIHNVTTLEPLIAQRQAKTAAVLTARYNLDRCKVTAPFDSRVTDLTISEGAYAHIGQQVFTLIDVRAWWVIGNFRESQLKQIQPGMFADVYVMSKPNQLFRGRVESIGFGVRPEEGLTSPGLPAIQRSLNWVHLATRFPVRVRVVDPIPDLFRIGESGVVVIRGAG
jgi:membrane fusion protein, multidrug efflux system